MVALLETTATDAIPLTKVQDIVVHRKDAENPLWQDMMQRLQQMERLEKSFALEQDNAVIGKEDPRARELNTRVFGDPEGISGQVFEKGNIKSMGAETREGDELVAMIREQIAAQASLAKSNGMSR